MRGIKPIAARILSGILAAALLVPAAGSESGTAADGNAGAGAAPRTYEYVESNPVFAPDWEGMRAVAENDRLVLYLREETSEVAVKCKETGAVFTSNPLNRAEDPIASATNRNKMSAQLLVSYYNASSTLFTIDNYTQSIAHGAFTVETVRDGVKITYTLSENHKEYRYPSVISAARMEAFCARLSEKEAEELKRRRYLKISLAAAKSEDERREMERLYPSLSEKNDLYTVRGTKSESIQQRIHELFAKAGYTAEELVRDNEENGVEAASSDAYVFKIPIVYQLEGGDLLAYIPGGEIEYSTKWPISTISLLPFFGAAWTEEEGYILVPDGSGALIRLNNGRTNTQGYYAKVYGEDYTRPSASKAADGLALPVFGINRTAGGLLAIIEDGEAFATLTADISGKVNSYNTAYASFEVLPSSSLELGDVLGTADKVLAFGSHIYQGNFQMRYRFLIGDTSYVGMAAGYREYLEGKGLLPEAPAGDTAPFVMDVIGSIDKTKSFMGVAYEGEVTLTTFEECAQIVGAVLDRGITPVVRYSGWMNGGMSQSAATRLKIQSALGGAGDFRSLAETLQGKGVPLYPDVSFQYSFGDPWFDGFSGKNDTARSPGGAVAMKYGYDVITNKLDKTLSAPYVINPSRYVHIAERFAAAYRGYDLSGLSVAGLGVQLNSDQNTKGDTDRQAAAVKTAQVLAALSGEYSLMGEGANLYAAAYMDYILGLPETSGRRYICDDEVPFLQMVFHGSVSYTGEAFNLSDDRERATLKAIETGGGLYVRWIYADNSLVKASNYSSLYAVQYQATLDRAVEAYKEITAALDGLNGLKITGHAALSEQVRKTVYEDGTAVYVNYGDTDYAGDGVTVKAGGYTVKRGTEA